MKIIEGLKEIKRLEEKVGDLTQKINTFCADLDVETPSYPDQKGQVNQWLQSAHDSLKEATRLRIAIQKTNLEVKVPIELGGVKVEHSISEWIIRRRLYAAVEEKVWKSLWDRNLKEGNFTNTTGGNIVIHIRRYYDPSVKDRKIEEFRGEPGIIDRTLEIVNATTDLVE